MAVLRRIRGWLLLVAVIIFFALFAGLIHDFGLSDPTAGWFTGQPAIPAVLLAIGYLCMLGYRFGARGEEE